MSDGHDIGRRVREARKRRGLTQRELVEISGLSLSLVTKLESGAVGGVRLATVHKLATALGVPTSALMSEPAAAAVIDLAIGDADDDLTAIAALDCKCWLLLRQGRLAESRELAAHWADATEPARISRATPGALAGWGRLLIWVSSASVRDNRPGDADEALRLARIAAAAIGADMIPHYNPWEVFGPATVAMARAENATIQGHPDLTLGIGARVTGRRYPLPRNYRRHRLDVAHALAATRQDGKAVGVLEEIRAQAPQWLAQQRYAGEILSAVIGRRRTLSDETRDLAEFLRLPI